MRSHSNINPVLLSNFDMHITWRWSFGPKHVIKSSIFFSFDRWMGGFHSMLWEYLSSQFLLGCLLPWCPISMCRGFLGQDAGVVEHDLMVSITFYVHLNLLLWFSKLCVIVVFILTLVLVDWLICTAYMLPHSQGMLYIPGDYVPRVAWCDWTGWRFVWVGGQSSWDSILLMMLEVFCV